MPAASAAALFAGSGGFAASASVLRPGAALLGAEKQNFLAHFDGADGSSVFTDATGQHVITSAGGAKIKTDQSVFGGASARFTAAGDKLTLDGSSDFSFGTGDFTVDFRVRLAATGVQYNLYDMDVPFNNGFSIYVTAANNVNLYNLVNDSVAITGNTAVSANTWYHIAATRAAGVTRLFINGYKPALIFQTVITMLLPLVARPLVDIPVQVHLH